MSDVEKGDLQIRNFTDRYISFLRGVGKTNKKIYFLKKKM